jgi:hypothetical protein
MVPNYQNNLKEQVKMVSKCQVDQITIEFIHSPALQAPAARQAVVCFLGTISKFRSPPNASADSPVKKSPLY